MAAAICYGVRGGGAQLGFHVPAGNYDSDTLSERGVAFVALLEEAVRTQRPDLLSARGAAVVDMQRHRLMEPSDLWQR